MVNSPMRIRDCDSHSHLSHIFFLLMLVFVLQWLSLHWEILIMLFHQWDALFHGIAYDYYADWDGLHNHLRDVP